MTLLSNKTIISLGFSLLVGMGILYQTRVVLCATDSLECINGMIAWRTPDVKRGDLAYIRGHRNKLFQKDFMKRVVGLPGDAIVLQDGALWVGQRWIGRVLSKTRQGVPLTPIAESVVPHGTLFVVGDHERSFDSRYQEFGLVKQSEVWGKGVILW